MGGKSGPDVPSTSEYMGMAFQQSQLGKELLQEQTKANRPNQYTPWGSSVWGEQNGKWTQNVNLPETQQQALEAQQRLGLGRSELAEGLLGQAEGDFADPIQWQAMQTNEVGPSGEYYSDEAADALYGRATSRLDPQWEQREEQTYNQLWNQGLRPGEEAWDNAMANMGRERTDAYQTAQRESSIFGGAEGERQFGMDFKRRQQAIAEELQRRGASINEINAIMTGQQVSSPNMPAFAQSGRAQPPDLLGAMGMGAQSELQQYNSGQMQDQGLMSGIMGLANAGASWAPFMFSDEYTKHDKHQIGTSAEGFPVYVYTNRRDQVEVGVMAQDMPEGATVAAPDGALMVDKRTLPASVSGAPVESFKFG